MGNFSRNDGIVDGALYGLYVWLCISRNKDNKNVEGFVPRTAAFVTDRSIVVEYRWKSFCGHAVAGEICRLYRSVNRLAPHGFVVVLDQGRDMRSHYYCKKKIICCVSDGGYN